MKEFESIERKLQSIFQRAALLNLAILVVCIGIFYSLGYDQTEKEAVGSLAPYVLAWLLGLVLFLINLRSWILFAKVLLQIRAARVPSPRTTLTLGFALKGTVLGLALLYVINAERTEVLLLVISFVLSLMLGAFLMLITNKEEHT